jgi:hypothetical protein
VTTNPSSTFAKGIDVAFCVIVVFNGCITNTLIGLLAEYETSPT